CVHFTQETASDMESTPVQRDAIRVPQARAGQIHVAARLQRRNPRFSLRPHPEGEYGAGYHQPISLNGLAGTVRDVAVAEHQRSLDDGVGHVDRRVRNSAVLIDRLTYGGLVVRGVVGRGFDPAVDESDIIA